MRSNWITFVTDSRKVVLFDPWDECESGVTVGELIRQLQMHDPNNYVCIGYHGHFTFERVHDCAGDGSLTQIEIREVEGQDYVLTNHHPYKQYKAEMRRSS